MRVSYFHTYNEKKEKSKVNRRKKLQKKKTKKSSKSTGFRHFWQYIKGWPKKFYSREQEEILYTRGQIISNRNTIKS